MNRIYLFQCEPLGLAEEQKNDFLAPPEHSAKSGSFWKRTIEKRIPSQAEPPMAKCRKKTRNAKSPGHDKTI